MKTVLCTVVIFLSVTCSYAQETATRKSGNRPQDPTDFPYRREAVTFPGGADSVTLAGELTLPENGPPKATLILVSGSGAQDRNESLGPAIDHRPFLVLSDHLTRQGYAVLRYDDRGVGSSTGDFAASTTRDFAADAAGAVEFLRGRAGLEGIPLGIAGHSEGGMIASMIAAEDDAVDFIALLAGPGVPIDSLMTQQRRMITQQTPADEPIMQAVFAYIKNHPARDSTAFIRGLRETVKATIPELPEEIRSAIVDADVFTDVYAKQLSSPWIRYFIAFDPAPYLERVTVPVLALNGTRDTQVAAKENLRGIDASLRRAGNDDVTILPLPGLNHLFQPANTGQFGEYGQIETTVDPVVLTIMTYWLDERFGG